MDLLTPSFGLIFWTLLAFLIVFFLLRKFAWGPILDSLHEREKTIADSIATAEKVRAEMSQLKSENEALLVQAREERAQMLKDARETREKIISDAKELAKTESGKIIADATAAIENQKMAALTDVKNQIGNMVIDVTEKVIRKQLDSRQSQEEYIRKLADDLVSLTKN